MKETVVVIPQNTVVCVMEVDVVSSSFVDQRPIDTIGLNFHILHFVGGARSTSTAGK